MMRTIEKSSNAIGTYSHHMPSNGGSAGRPAGSASPIGRMPHDRSRVPIHTAGSTVISSPSIDELPAPRAHLGEPLRVQRDSGARPQDVPLLLHDVEQPVPRQIDGDALGLVQDDAQPVQRVGDLDAVAHHVLVEPVGVDGVRKVHRRLRRPRAGRARTRP